MIKTAGATARSGTHLDAHIADVARVAGAAGIVADNRRHFISALRRGIRVETPDEFVSALKQQLRG